MIVVCGEALMDVFGGADTAAGVSLDARVGGSPFNVAVGLARLAQPVGFFGAISRDFLGARLLRALKDEGVDTDAVARVAAPTTLSLVGTDAQGVPNYAFYGHGGADRQLVIADLDHLPARISALHLGSYSTVVEPVATTLSTLVERRRGDTLISVDPNVRLNVEPDAERWRRELSAMQTRAHLLKISEEDLGLLRPGVSVDEFGEQALRDGVGLVVVTRGQAGAVARTRQAVVRVPGIEVAVVDTVGAGDTFQAALLTWLAEHDRLSAEALPMLDADALRAAVDFAARAAAITCTRRGADLPRRGELG